MSFLNKVVKSLSPLVSKSMLSWGAREYFNHHYPNVGFMTSLHIDPVRKSATMELNLKGEVQPLQVEIGKYEVTTLGGTAYIVIKELKTSRDWINIVAGELLKDKKFEVPELVKSLL